MGLHIRLDKSVDLRKALLEAALISTEMLATLEDHDKLDQQETISLKNVRKTTSALTKEITTFMKQLPEVPADFLEHEEPSVNVRLRNVQPVIVPARDSVQSEIQRIKKRLEALGVR